MIVSTVADTLSAMNDPLKDLLGTIGSAINACMWVAGAPSLIEEYVENPHASAWDIAGWGAAFRRRRFGGCRRFHLSTSQVGF